MGPSGLKFHAKGHGSSTWRSSGYHPGWKRPPRVKFLMGRGQAADLVCSLLICENYVAACRIASNSVDLFRFFFYGPHGIYHEGRFGFAYVWGLSVIFFVSYAL